MHNVKMSQAGDTEYGTLDIQHPKHHLTTPWKVVIIITLLAALAAIGLGVFAIAKHEADSTGYIKRYMPSQLGSLGYADVMCPVTTVVISGYCNCYDEAGFVHRAALFSSRSGNGWACDCPNASDFNYIQATCLTKIDT